MKKQLFAALLVSSMLFVSCTEEGILFSKEFAGEGEILVNEANFAFDLDLDNLNVEINNITIKDGCLDLQIYDYGEPRIEVRTNKNIFDDLSFIKDKGGLKISGSKDRKYVTEGIIISLFGVKVGELDVLGFANVSNSLYGFNEDLAINVKGQMSGTLNLEQSKKLNLNVSGAADLNLVNLNLDTLQVDVKGALDLSGEGSIDEYRDNIKGTAVMELRDVDISKANINCSGVGTYGLFVEEILDIKSSNVISIEYMGNPVVTTTLAGVNHIAKID